jgi:hypothetical protein
VSQGVSVKKLRAAVGLSRKPLEDAYLFLKDDPPSAHRPLRIELIRGTACDSAIGHLPWTRLIEHNRHHLCVTTGAFLVNDFADLPPPDSRTDDNQGTPEPQPRA